MNTKKFLRFVILYATISFALIFSILSISFFVYRGEMFHENDVIKDEVVLKLDQGKDLDNSLLYYKDTDRIRITVINKNDKSIVYDNINTVELDDDINKLLNIINIESVEYSTFLNKNIAKKTYVISKYNYLIRIEKEVANTYFILRNCYIIIPIITFVINLILIILVYLNFKKSFIPLKNQVRKLNKVIGNITTIDDYQSDSVSLSNSIRTSRKEIEKILKEKDEYASQLNFILDSIEQGIIVYSDTNEPILFNKKALDIFSLTKEKLANNGIEYINNIELYKLIKIAKRLNKKTQDYINVDDKVYECEVFPVSYSWSKKDIKPGVSILLIDVTDEYNSKKMKEEFFANVAHEIKSPLTSILGYQEMIKEEILTTPEEIKEANQVTIKEAQRLKEIVSNMLGLSSIEKNELRTIEKINIKSAIEDIIDSEKLKINEKNIKVILNLKPYIVKMNAQDFDILFRNLIENAIKYNKENGSIMISLDDENNSITVSDTGIGIDSEYISRIFERFFRVNKARSLKDGTGLGLSLVKHTCLYYGFKIEIESKINEGSSFKIKLK